MKAVGILNNLKSFVSSLIFNTFIILALGSCQYDPHAKLYTTEKPDDRDVVGQYELKSQSISSDGSTTLEGKKSTISLREDGTYIATNILPEEIRHTNNPENFTKLLINDSGKWHIGQVGGVDDGKKITYIWGVYLDSTTRHSPYRAINLINTKPSYSLLDTFGDSDEGKVMIFEKYHAP